MFTSGNCSATSNVASCQVECASSSSRPPWACCARTRVTPAVSCGALVVTSRSISPFSSTALAPSKPCLHHGSLVAHGSTSAVFTASWPPSACPPSPPPPEPSSSSPPQPAMPAARTAAMSQTDTAFPLVLLTFPSLWGTGSTPNGLLLLYAPTPFRNGTPRAAGWASRPATTVAVTITASVTTYGSAPKISVGTVDALPPLTACTRICSASVNPNRSAPPSTSGGFQRPKITRAMASQRVRATETAAASAAAGLSPTALTDNPNRVRTRTIQTTITSANAM